MSELRIMKSKLVFRQLAILAAGRLALGLPASSHPGRSHGTNLDRYVAPGCNLPKTGRYSGGIFSGSDGHQPPVHPRFRAVGPRVFSDIKWTLLQAQEGGRFWIPLEPHPALLARLAFFNPDTKEVRRAEMRFEFLFHHPGRAALIPLQEPCHACIRI